MVVALLAPSPLRKTPETAIHKATLILVECRLVTGCETITTDTSEREVATIAMIGTEIVTTGMAEKGTVTIATNEKETVIDSTVTWTAITTIATLTWTVIAIGTEKDHHVIWTMIDTTGVAEVNAAVKEDVITHGTVAAQVDDVKTKEEEIVIEFEIENDVLLRAKIGTGIASEVAVVVAVANGPERRRAKRGKVKQNLLGDWVQVAKP